MPVLFGIPPFKYKNHEKILFFLGVFACAAGLFR